MNKFRLTNFVLLLLFLWSFGQYLSANYYENVDKHALSVSAPQNNVVILTRKLTRPFRSQDEKIRAIYRWITANIKYDMDAYNERRLGNFRPSDIISSGECICGGYANLFKIMANIAGFEAEFITGYSKGYSFDAETIFQGDIQHAWNVVKVNGKWQLIDATWGAGYINDEKNFVSAFNDYYFFTPPDQLIKTHFPNLVKWQLLKHKKSREDFANSVYTRPAFYHYGLAAISHPFYHIETENNLQIKLSADPDILILGRLFLDEEKMADEFTFTQKRGNVVEVNVLLPDRQKYKVRIFARRKNMVGPYEWVMDYAVSAEQGSRLEDGFPLKYRSFMERNAYLYAPLRKKLQSGHLEKFLIKVERAQKVAVILDGRLYYLKPMGKALFSGAATIPRGEIFLAAQYPGNDQLEYLLGFEGW